MTRHPPHPWHINLLTVAVCAAVAVMVVSLAATVVYVRRADQIRRSEQVSICERGNQIRVTLNFIFDHFGLDRTPLPILDCQSIVR